MHRTLDMVKLPLSSIQRLSVIPLFCLIIQACSTSQSPLEPPAPGSRLEPPGPQQAPSGAIDVSIQVTGEPPNPEADLVVVRIIRIMSDDVGPVAEERAVPSTGGTVRFVGLPPGTYWVRLERFARDCSVQGADPRPVSLGGGQTLQVAFSVACQSLDIPNVPGSVAGIYERSSPHWSGTIEFHGSLSERYVILEDGTFRLQYDSERFGFFQYPGSYSSYPPVGPTTALLLVFDGDGRWSATATLRDNCLIVEYNLIMALSDFEDGEYCKS